MNYFTVQVIGSEEYSREVYAETRGAAKYSFLLSLWDAWGDEAVSFKDLRVLPTGRRERPPIAQCYFAPGRGRRVLRKEVTARVIAFLEALPTAYTRAQWRAQWDHSYPMWARDDSGWMIIGMGGTNIMQALMWYHHMHRPGSQEHRAGVILGAVIGAALGEMDAVDNMDGVDAPCGVTPLEKL